MSVPRPTLRSLAAEAAVSPMTVSLALRNSPEVSPAMRRRLQRLAARRGYRPDPMITRLMHHLRAAEPTRFKASICGLRQGWAPERFHATNYRVRLEQGMRDRAEALGYGFSLIDIDEYPTAEQLQRVLGNRGIEGLVILPLRSPCDVTERVDWSGFATVSTTPSVTAPLFHRVVPHHFENMLEACTRLLRSGFRRIGLALTMEWELRVHHRWTGGLAWHNLFGGATPIPPFIGTEAGPNIAPDAFIAWVTRERPDVILCETHDRAAFTSILQSLPARNRPAAATLNWPNPPAGAGIDQRPERIGEVAIEVLAAMLTRGEKGVPALPNTTMIDGRWMAGRSWPVEK